MLLKLQLQCDFDNLGNIVIIWQSRIKTHIFLFFSTFTFTFTGDKINSATHNGEKLPRNLVQPMWRLNKERNLLVHERSYNQIANRQSFIDTYESVKKQLQQLIAPTSHHSRSSDTCLIC